MCDAPKPMFSDVCDQHIHAIVRRNPQLMVNLRHWPEMGAWIGECATCMSTLGVSYEVVPPPADELADMVLP